MSVKRQGTQYRLPRVADEEDSGSQKIRVLMISTVGEMGGAERSFFELLRACPRERVAPQVCAPPGSPLSRLCLLGEAPVHTQVFRRFRRTTNLFVLGGQVKALYQSARGISAICRDQQIDLLHANTDSAALVAWEASRQSGCPFVWHCRDLRPLHGLAGPLSRAAAAVVPISGAVERHLRNEGVQPEKIRRIDNGIDLSRFHAGAEHAAVRARTRARLDVPEGCPVLLGIGAYVPWKRHDVFLRTLVALRQRCPNAAGWLVGSDMVSANAAYGDELLRLAEESGLLRSGVLRVLNERDDVPDLMAAADLLLSCSEHEPWGRVVAEAGASGLPVVSVNSGAKSEIVADGVTGVLVEPGDEAGLAAACLALVNNPQRRAEMARAARERIGCLFDVRRTAQQTADIFVSIGKKRPGPDG